MPKGLIRSSGGLATGRLSYRVSLKSIVRYGGCAGLEARGPSVDELRTLRRRLRDAFAFFLAQRDTSMSRTDVRKVLEKIVKAAKRLLKAPGSRTWQNRLDDLLTTTRTGFAKRPNETVVLMTDEDVRRYRQSPQSMLIVRSILFQQAGGSELNSLERVLFEEVPVQLPNGCVGLNVMPVGRCDPVHLETLQKLAELDIEGAIDARTVDSREPALSGLVEWVIPIWERITGKSTWATLHVSDTVADDMISPLTPWLQDILGDVAPSNDQIIRATVRLKKSKNKH